MMRKTVMLLACALAGGAFAAERDLQAEIDRASAAGGGEVRLGPGVHVSKPIELKSGVTLYLEKGAVLSATTDIADYAYTDRDAAFVRANGASDIAIRGEGVIDGNGAAFASPSDARTERLFPRLVLLSDATNVVLEGVTLTNPARWTCYLRRCNGFTVKGITIRSHANVNNDGLDIESRRGTVEDCTIDSGDDALVFKCLTPGYEVHDVTVRNCRLSSNASAIKVGTETHGTIRDILVENCTATPCDLSTRKKFDKSVPGADPKLPGGKCGLALIVADGGTLRKMTVRNVDLGAASTPIFIRLEPRTPAAKGVQSQLRQILLQNIKGVAQSHIASSITGAGGLRPRYITLSDIDIQVPGGCPAALLEKPIPESPTDYPMPRMFGRHPLAGHGLYIRHADDVTLDNVNFTLKSPDPRPAVFKEDARVQSIKWIDGKTLPIEGRAFDDTAAHYDRLPAEAAGRVTTGVWHLSHHTAGMRYCFRTDSRTVKVKWDLLEPGLDAGNLSRCAKSGFDLYRRRPGDVWKFRRALPPQGQFGNVGEYAWTPGDECMINFPLYNGVTRVQIGIDEGAKIEPLVPKAKPIVWYGVSTTQGASASRPGLAFPSIVARRLDLPYVNLGFSGCGKMEMEMCDYVARLEASVYVIDTPGNLSPQLMRERYEKFIRELHRRRPDTPIVLAEQRVYSSEVKLPTEMDVILEELRDKLLAEGGWTLGHVYSKDMFPNEIDETTADSPGGHPTDFGMMQLADAYQKAIESVLKK